MNPRSLLSLNVAGILLLAGFASVLGTSFGIADGFPAGHIDFFETRVRPVLTENCYPCHSATSEKLKGGLRLDTRALILKGGETGPAIVAGQPDESFLIKAVRYKNQETAMPPKKRLLDTQIADLEYGCSGVTSRAAGAHLVSHNCIQGIS